MAAGVSTELGRPTCVGRQPIMLADGTPVAYELLHRTRPASSTSPDTWPEPAQDLATGDVLAVASALGFDRLGAGRPVFVNVTAGVLVPGPGTPSPLADLPPRVGIEVLESVRATTGVRAALTDLRARGHVVALDDWTASAEQRALLPLADVVKVDLRDLVVHGPGLLDGARAFGALLVVERIETAGQLARCVDLGADFFQGWYLAPVQVIDAPVPAGAAA